MIADDNTMTAAGRRVVEIVQSAGVAVHQHIFPGTPLLKPTTDNGNAVAEILANQAGVPLVVGSGVLNDVAKYAAHRVGRPYFCVASAASMDGYSSAGAPLSEDGFKHTIQCKPPRIIVADLDVIASAPTEMTGWGYGDLAGKMPAGADWILADHLDIEAIDDVAWPLVQDNLRGWLAEPAALLRGDRQAGASLLAGLVLAGLAMEFHGSSRPASGADHQVAHLWEMENISHDGLPVAHGACVSLGTLTIMSLYDWLLEQDLTALDADALIASRLRLPDEEAMIVQRFGGGTIADRSIRETRIKYPSDDALRDRVERIRSSWPQLRNRLRQHLLSAATIRDMLAAAGVVTHPGRIGMSRAHHRRTVIAARYIRQRYTVLDFLTDTGLFETALGAVFGPGGFWSEEPEGSAVQR